jgi:LysM repeat protein
MPSEVTRAPNTTVSVHGIPKDQYDSGGAVPTTGGAPAPTGGGGGIIGNIKQHWPVWMVGLGLATIAVMVYISYSRNSSSSTSGSAGIDPTTGLPFSSEMQQGLYGSQIDANQQQIISLLNGLQPGGGTGQGAPPPTPPPPAPPIVTPPVKDPVTVFPNVHNPFISSPHTYTVRGGDTLFGIAQSEGFSNWQSLYNFGTNAQTVQSTAKAHGQFNPSDPGHWIYPGEQLQVH